MHANEASCCLTNSNARKISKRRELRRNYSVRRPETEKPHCKCNDILHVARRNFRVSFSYAFSLCASKYECIRLSAGGGMCVCVCLRAWQRSCPWNSRADIRIVFYQLDWESCNDAVDCLNSLRIGAVRFAIQLYLRQILFDLNY